MLISLCVALALASSPKAAVVVMDDAEALRGDVESALAADPTVQAQPRSLVEELMAAAAEAGLACGLDDATCWTKVGLDGDLDQLIVVGRGPSGAVELRLIDVDSGEVAGSVTLESDEDFNASAALARLLHPDTGPPEAPLGDATPGPEPPSTTTKAPEQPEARPDAPPAPAAAPPAAPPQVAAPLPVLLISAGGLGVVGAACGVAAAAIDVNLMRMLVDAKDAGVRLDLEDYRSQELAQLVFIGCASVAGVLAGASVLGSLVSE